MVVVVIVVVVDEGEELAVFHPSESNVGLRPIGYIVENFRRKYYTNFNANLVYLFLVVVTISTFFFFQKNRVKIQYKGIYARSIFKPAHFPADPVFP